MELDFLIIFSVAFHTFLPITAVQHGEYQEYPHESFVYQSYQKSITCTAESPLFQPQTLSDIEKIVAYAIESNKTIKAFGNLHSVTDCICTKHIPINTVNMNHFSYDPTTQRATVGAGMKLVDFMTKLHEHRRAILSAPSYGAITVGGAIGTGAHGSTLKHPTTLSDQIFSVTIVDGRGNIRKIDATEEDFKAFRVNLGLLGIVFEVVVNTVEQYKIQMTHIPVHDDILWIKEGPESILHLARMHDVFQFWWFPTDKEVVLSYGDRMPVDTPGTCEIHQISEAGALDSGLFSTSIEIFQSTGDHIGLQTFQSLLKKSFYKQIPVRNPFYTKADGITSCLPSAIGYSHKMLTNACKECAWNHGKSSLYLDDGNVAVPLDEFYAALGTLKEIFEKKLTLFPMNGIYFRFVSSSDSLIALNSNQDVASIEWITNPRFDKSQPKASIEGYQLIGQALVDKHYGRPHWGKNGLMYHLQEIIYQAHPLMQKFVDAMKLYDPDGLFMNDFGSRIRYRTKQITAAPDMVKNCGLTEFCKCEKDSQCGPYKCGEFMGYKICKQGVLEDIREKISREIIVGTKQLEIPKHFSLNNYTAFGNLFIGDGHQD